METEKRNKIIKNAFIIIGILIVLVGFQLIKNKNNDELCIYEIPNHLRMNCGNKTVNFFNANLYAYERAINSGCEFYEIGISSNTSSFFINECGLNVSYPIELFP